MPTIATGWIDRRCVPVFPYTAQEWSATLFGLCFFVRKRKKAVKYLPFYKKGVSLHSLNGKAQALKTFTLPFGALVQLVRIHACHAWGHGFESRTHRHLFGLSHGSLAQLNRASDYGSEGCRFESCMSHKLTGSLAQLNRASDYGSEGCRFESCMSHTKGLLLERLQPIG